MTRRTFTPDELRELAKDRGPYFADTARAALAYCADVLEAADKAVRHEAADALQARRELAAAEARNATLTDDAARAAQPAKAESLNSIVFALARLTTWNPTEAVLHQIDRLADHFEGEKIGTSFRLLARDARNPKRHPPMTRLVFSGESEDTTARAAASISTNEGDRHAEP